MQLSILPEGSKKSSRNNWDSSTKLFASSFSNIRNITILRFDYSWKINKNVENFRVLRLKLQEIFTIQKDQYFIFSGERNKNVDKNSVASTKILFLQKMSNSEIIMF